MHHTHTAQRAAEYIAVRASTTRLSISAVISVRGDRLVPFVPPPLLAVAHQHHRAHAGRVAQPAVADRPHVGRGVERVADQDQRVHDQEPDEEPPVPVPPHRAVEHQEQQPAQHHQHVLARPPAVHQRQARDQHQHQRDPRHRQREEVPVERRAHERHQARVLQDHRRPEAQVPHLQLLQRLERVLRARVQDSLPRRQREERGGHGRRQVQDRGAEVLDVDVHFLGRYVPQVRRVHGKQRVAVVRDQREHQRQLHQRESAGQGAQRVVGLSRGHGLGS